MRELNTIKEDKVLYGQYNWFYNNFLPRIQTSSDEFFSDFFAFKFASLSNNINILLQGDEYFVTKVRVDREHDVFFRLSGCAIDIILGKILGEAKKFSLEKITELEAKIISSFNDFLYNNISQLLLEPPRTNKKRKNFDTLHLTLFVRDKNSEDSGKLIVSIPKVLVSPEFISSMGDKFDVSDFRASKVDVNIKVGTTKFHVKDLKALEKEDIVIFEDSNIHNMRLLYKDYEKDFRIAPNPGLIMSLDDNGGDNMTENSLSQNLWDNIQVEMGAEFDKVKITLGELKNIEQGLVVDISSVYDNKISLKVENKVIARGELVIINDRYGVRIDEVFASEKMQEPEFVAQEQVPASIQEEAPAPEVTEPATAENAEEEFDYSDFELDDQDI